MNRIARVYRHSLVRLSLVSFLLASCSGGGGGSSAPDPGGQTPDSYSEDGFDYEDPHAPEFQPLGLDSTVLTSRDELLILDVPEDLANARATLFDDIGAGAGVLEQTPGLAGAGAWRTAAAGNFDDDGEREFAMIQIIGGVLQVVFVELVDGGVSQPFSAFTIPSAGFPYGEVKLSLADVDGDFRDELVLVARRNLPGSGTDDHWMRVYDDPSEGSALLHELPWGFGDPGNGLWDVEALEVTAIDVDGDGRDELGVLVQVGSSGSFGSVELHLALLEDAEAGFVRLAPWFEVENLLPSESTASRLLAGDFDGDGQQELAATWGVFQSIQNSHAVYARRIEWGSGGPTASSAWSSSYNGSGISFDLHPHRAWDAECLDLDADGTDELVLLRPRPFSSNSTMDALRWSGGSFLSEQALSLGGLHTDDAASLVATDDDADGQDELYFCSMSGPSGSDTKTRRVNRIEFGGTGASITNAWTSSPNAPGSPYPPVLVPGDFDADGQTIRYTGRKFTSLADPKPIVVMAAAPTKAGIQQLYANSNTNYTYASGSSESISVSNSVTASVYSGFSVSDLFDLFGVSARQTVDWSLTKTESTTQSVDIEFGFTGPYDADTIVFLGTLYQSYEYEILSANDPSLVGTLMTIDVPAQSRIYKWGVEHYNAQVEPELRIGDDVLGHAIGDPASYPTRAELAALTDEYVGWITSDAPPQSVGAVGQSTSVAIHVASEAASTEERQVGVTWEAGFSAGGAEYGGSFGLSDSTAYTLAISESTTYACQVGDIVALPDYEAWRFDYGIAVHHRGLRSDGANQPLEYEPGVLPYQVLQVWVDPVGSGY